MSAKPTCGEMTNEEWYDAEVAPALAEMAKRCQERGMSFIANVEYEPGEIEAHERAKRRADHMTKCQVACVFLEKEEILYGPHEVYCTLFEALEFYEREGAPNDR